MHPQWNLQRGKHLIPPFWMHSIRAVQSNDACFKTPYWNAYWVCAWRLLLVHNPYSIRANFIYRKIHSLIHAAMKLCVASKSPFSFLCFWLLFFFFLMKKIIWKCNIIQFTKQKTLHRKYEVNKLEWFLSVCMRHQWGDVQSVMNSIGRENRTCKTNPF